jgi:dynein heavy chain
MFLLIRYQINTSKEILSVILSIQPKEGSGIAGGETREAAVYKIADDILSKLPRSIGVLEV